MKICGLHIGLLTLLMGLGTLTNAQELEKHLSFQDFVKIVRENHPMSVQAGLQNQRADETLKQAKGNLDPKLYNDIRQKYYSGDEYYSLIDAGLKIPTWIGWNIEAGYEVNRGQFLNPEANTPEDGLWYAGVSVPIGKGMLMDKRRAELKKARIFIESSEAIQAALLNDLLLDAGEAYWNWFEKYHNVKVYESALNLVLDRFAAVKQGAAFGDLPSIDTLEAGIQVQNRQLLLKQAELDFMNAGLLLSVFLWADGTIPLELDSNVVPPEFDEMLARINENEATTGLEFALENHPQLLIYKYKLQEIEVDQRLKKEMLKPELNLKYNALTGMTNSEINTYNPANYQWGLSFSMPIFLREARGDLRLTQLKAQETQLERVTKSTMLANKVQSYRNAVRITRDQVQLYTRTVKDYSGLLEGEVEKFNGGESSLFMVNSREIGYINARLKLVSLVSKNRKALLGTRYALGNLYLIE